MEYYVENVGMGRSFEESFHFLKDAEVYAQQLSIDHNHLIIGIWLYTDETEPNELVELYHRGRRYTESEGRNE